MNKKLFPKSRKGDKMLSVYWFVIVFISAAAVVYMVAVFYGHPYDVRELEANVLANKFADCISQEGRLDSRLFDGSGGFSQEFKANILENCKVNFNVEDKWKDPQYYIDIGFFRVGGNNPTFEIKEGNLNLVSGCELQKDEKYEKLATCVEKRFYSVGNGEQYLVKILSVVRKTEKNVKL